MNLLSMAGMSIAVGQIRQIEANMFSVVQGLVLSGKWSGNDANRFLSEWQELVSYRLHGAVANLERIDLKIVDNND